MVVCGIAVCHVLTAYVRPVSCGKRIWISTLCYICGCNQRGLERNHSVSGGEKHFLSAKIHMDIKQTHTGNSTLTSGNHIESDFAGWLVADILLLNYTQIELVPSQQWNRIHRPLLARSEIILCVLLHLWVYLKCIHHYTTNNLVTNNKRDYLVSKDQLRSSVLHLYYCPLTAQLQQLEAFQSDNLLSEISTNCVLRAILREKHTQ